MSRWREKRHIMFTYHICSKVQRANATKNQTSQPFYMAVWQYPDNKTPGCPTISSTQEDSTQYLTILNSCRFKQQQQQVEKKKWAQREP
jgi:hypothetical protein